MERKLIGMVTPHYAANYGAKVQAYALAESLRKLGYDIEYINRRPKIGTYSDGNPILRQLKKLEEIYNRKYFYEFEDKYLQPQSTPIYTNEDLDKLDLNRYYGFTIGSDQMWRDNYYRPTFTPVAYLDFAKNYEARKVAYAVSFGKATCVHPEDRRQYLESLIKKFTAVSVREKSGVDILKETFHVDKGVWVADPTLLLNKEEYVKNFNLKELPTPRKETATYILSDNYKTVGIYEKIGVEIGLPMRHFLKPKKFRILYNHYVARLPFFLRLPSVISWFDTILNAQYFVTDSFHGTVFAIIFGKQFVTLDNSVGGSERLTSLLGMLGLEDRLFNFTSSPKKIAAKIKEPIDYQKVYSKLKPFVDSSRKFLEDSLK